ncbi:MAG: sigma-70 family RNA polymerase sigma factor [Clostridia bacterium]|nr:sigma-70 family RNA polymerase sigma factor [Clostridia bacterium]
MDDRRIIELYNQRHEKAISETSLKYGKYCFSIANNILGDPRDSEECVNDTWLKTWNSIPPHEPTSLKLFLGKITRNLSFNKYKESHRQKRGGGEIELALDEIDEIVADVRDIESELEEKAFIGTVNRFLHSLPERDCNIFIRRYFHAYSVQRIAQKYDMSENNVSKVLSRTREKLKKYLRSEGYIK